MGKRLWVSVPAALFRVAACGCGAELLADAAGGGGDFAGEQAGERYALFAEVVGGCAMQPYGTGYGLFGRDLLGEKGGNHAGQDVAAAGGG